MKHTALALLAGLALSIGAAPAALADPPGKAPPPGRATRKPPRAEAPREPTQEERLAEARRLFGAAEQKYEAGDFAGALEGFRAAQAVVPSALGSFRIARCVDKVGTRSEAREAYHRFLGSAASETLTDERRIAEERLADLAAGTLRITSQPASVSVQVDGRPGAATPVDLRLAPGKHVVLASAPDYESATQEIDVPESGTVQLAIALKGVPPPPPPPPPPAPAPPPPAAPRAPSATILAGVSFGLSAVGVAVGTAFGVRALSAKSDFGKRPTQALADQEQSSAVISDGALGGAVVLAVVGAVFVTHRRAADAAPSTGLAVVPLLSPAAQGAAVRIRF